ncbi:hypothetical protein [Helicobacter equorum]|uniref:hypothetical protein n=1 Tax=Helicobacter equorum TaxID=361872 RepID=UPI000CF1B1C3|nr:hypothetical protein [Helicobacter equorum]
MIEDVLQTQPKAQKLVEKTSTRNSEFEKYLKETTQNLERLTTKSTQTQVAAKPTQVKDTKESKTTPKDSSKLAESTQKKEQTPKKHTPETTELLAASLTPEALKSQSTATPPQAPKDTPLTQALKATQEQGTKIAQDKQALQAQNTGMQPKIAPYTKDQAPKTLDDVQELAKDKGLNPTNVSSQAQEIQPKPKATPKSAKQKIQYEMENLEDRVAVINRGTKKPQNITSKISNIYEEGKTEQSVTTLGSMLGPKDLPRQS